MLLRNVVGQHIGLDHKRNVCPVVTKFAYRYLSLRGVFWETGKLTRVMARAQKTLFLASLFRVKHKRRESEGAIDVRKAQAPHGI